MPPDRIAGSSTPSTKHPKEPMKRLKLQPVPILRSLGACVLATLLATPLAPAWAGRPLASDDAATADAGTCQVETWAERAGDERALVLAPACGVVEGLELGIDATRPQPRDTVSAAAGLALKWAPKSWRVETGAGPLNLGLKVATAFERPTGHGWHGAGHTLLALATLTPRDDIALHLNLGRAHDSASGSQASLLNLALSWAPSEQSQLFIETQANSRREVFGGTLTSLGGRWWLLPEKLGLDLTASRVAGASGPTLWTVGLGWYGISF